jgi:oligosaccharide repeat unit polymerase
VNPLFLFLAVWGAAIALYMGGMLAGLFSPARLGTVGVVILNVGVCVLGYLTWTVFRAREHEPAGLSVPSEKPLNLSLMKRGLRFTLLMGAVAMALGLYRTAIIASYFGTSVFDLLTQPQLLRLRLVMFIGATIYEANYLVMLISLTSSLFSIGFVLLGVFLYVSTERSRYAYAGGFLLVSLTVGLTNLSRYEVTVNILYLVLTYAFVWTRGRRRRVSKALADLVWPMTVVVVLFVAIDVLLRKGATYAQPGAVRGFLFSIYWYIASPLAALNEFLAGFDGQYHFGQSTFLPLYKWLCRFDLAPEPALSLYGEMKYIPYPANCYTYLRTFYEDFGILGVAIVPYAAGWATAALRVSAGAHFHHLNVYVVLLVFVLLSFYNYLLISNQTYLQILFGFLLFRYAMPCHQRERPDTNSDASAEDGADVQEDGQTL